MIVKLLTESIVTYAERAKERIAKKDEDDLDEDAEDSLTGETDCEEQILSKVRRLVTPESSGIPDNMDRGPQVDLSGRCPVVIITNL